MQTIVMTIGAPASGKTTWAKEQLKKNIDRWKRINRDDLRMMHNNRLFEPGTHERERHITLASNALVREALQAGYDVVLDNTNLDGRARKEIHKLAEAHGDVTVIEKVFEVPLKELLRRDQGRTLARVGDDVIENFAKRFHMDPRTGAFKNLRDSKTYYPPHSSTETSGVRQDETLPKAVICDLDGTLALMNGRNPYDASTCDQDLPNWPVIETLKALHLQGRKIIFVSGRHDLYMPQTVAFIEKYCRIPANWAFSKDDDRPEDVVIPYELYMRRTGDNRKDSLIKREIYDENIKDRFYVELVIDDRPQVVRMWRHELGFTVFQLNDREF